MLANTVLRRAVQRQVRQFSAFENKNTIKEVRSKYYTNNTAGKWLYSFLLIFFLGDKFLKLYFFVSFSHFILGAEHPTYLKEPGDKLVAFVAAGGIFVGLAIIGRGLYSMANGVNKVSP